MEKLNYPTKAHWEVTPVCNQNCIHCSNYWRTDAHLQFRSSRTVEEYINIATNLINLGVKEVVITGGEPFIVWNMVKPAINKLIDNHILVSINTNIILLDEEKIEFMKAKKIRLFISFPCINEYVCDFITNKKSTVNRIICSLDQLAKNQIPFALNIVVSKLNLNYVEETVDFLKKRYDIDKIYITRASKPINANESFNKYLLERDDINNLLEMCVRIHKKHSIIIDTVCPYTPCSITTQEAFDLFGHSEPCSAGKTKFSIDFSGRVKACPRDSHFYGNIFEEPFEIILNRMKVWKDGTLIPEECKECSEKDNCLGGCRVDMFPFTGKLNSLDSISNPSNIPLKFK